MPNIIGYDSMTTVEGDTFDKLALRYYNDERQSSIIICKMPDIKRLRILTTHLTSHTRRTIPI